MRARRGAPGVRAAVSSLAAVQRASRAGCQGSAVAGRLLEAEGSGGGDLRTQSRAAAAGRTFGLTRARLSSRSREASVLLRKRPVTTIARRIVGARPAATPNHSGPATDDLDAHTVLHPNGDRGQYGRRPQH